MTYKSNDGFCIVKIDEAKYYYGNGAEINAIGTSANQFLRFNPYMDYVGGTNEQPSQPVTEWIMGNIDKE